MATIAPMTPKMFNLLERLVNVCLGDKSHYRTRYGVIFTYIDIDGDGKQKVSYMMSDEISSVKKAACGLLDTFGDDVGKECLNRKTSVKDLYALYIMMDADKGWTCVPFTDKKRFDMFWKIVKDMTPNKCA